MLGVTEIVNVAISNVHVYLVPLPTTVPTPHRRNSLEIATLAGANTETETADDFGSVGVIESPVTAGVPALVLAEGGEKLTDFVVVLTTAAIPIAQPKLGRETSEHWRGSTRVSLVAAAAIA